MKGQEAKRAMNDHEANLKRIEENTARLKALRLAKEAADAVVPKNNAPTSVKSEPSRKPAKA